MSTVLELSAAVQSRRAEMGLTQALLAQLSGLSRATVNQVETGNIKDLSLSRASRLLAVLGLSLGITAPRTESRTSPLVLAARTASVSHRVPISAEQLREVMLTGVVPPGLSPHVFSLLDEAPLPRLVAVVEQLQGSAGVERAELWRRMRELARSLKSTRDIWQ